MDKKITKRIALMGLTVLSFTALLTSSIAWFKQGIDVDFAGIGTDAQVAGGLEKSFYGGGTGTENDPYIISDRNHLYNLAWLQYIGTYNKDAIQQCYFEVTADIDMTGITLPPIGTDQYPFLGNFDGQGHIISNVSISNDDPMQDNSAFGVTKPSSTALTGTTPPQVVGFFGVVGKMTGQNITYDSTIVEMTNFTLNSISVSSKTNQTLMGLAAGYVNGAMNSVKVAGTASLNLDGQSTTACLDSITDKITNYGLVGYTTKTSRGGTYRQDLSSYYDSDDDSGAGDDWGGSIAVEEIFDRLSSIKSSYAVQNNNLPTELTNYYREGAFYSGPEVTNSNNSTSNPVFEYNEDTYQGNSYNNKLGAFQFGDDRTDIHYLSGGHYTKNVQQVKHQYRPITDGTHYLSIYVNNNNAALFTNASSSDTCTVWNLPVGSSGKIYTIEQYAGSTQYITIVNGVLELATSANSAVNWTVTANNGYLTIVSGNYHLVFDDEWLVKDSGQTNEVYYHIYTNGHYFYPGGTDTTNPFYLKGTNDASQQIKWYYDSTYRAYYYMRNGASRYLMHTSSYNVIANNSKNNQSEFYRLYTSNNSNNPVVSGTGKLKYSGSNSTIVWNNNNDNGWGLANNWNNGSTFTVEQISIPIVINDNVLDTIIDYYGPDTTNLSEYMDYSGQDVTYFPLNTKSDYTPADNNTGYIIGGSSYTSSNTDYGNGTVRIANFYSLADNIGNYSKTTHKLTNVRTYNASGPVTINDTSNTYQRYADSKEKVEGILKKHESDDKLYGLHFMQNLISQDNLVTARYAQINTTVHNNYQLPASSIDFNLKERGFVNFFAGTYGKLSGESTTTIDSFFSLHLIQRNSSEQIIGIYEIDEILSDGNQDHAYIYHLSNGKYTIPYSYDIYNQQTKYVVDTTTPLGDVYPNEEFTFVDTCPNTYSVAFDTSWIKVHNDYAQHYMYYFEIPINCGEFCLGSVSGSHFGAYLIYLDIGAFARDNDKVEAYHVTTFANSVAYPDGVDFAVASATGTGGESMGVYLGSGITGSISFEITSSNIKVTDTGSLSTYAFKGTKYSDSSGSNVFTVSGNTPGALVLPPAGGERLIHITVDAVDNSTWFIDILDTLDTDGNIISTSYPLIKKNGADQQPSAIPTSVTSVLDEKIRALGRIATFTRTAGTEEFVTTATYDTQTRKVVAATITSENLSSISITVSNIATGYTISINGTPVSNNSVYPAS